MRAKFAPLDTRSMFNVVNSLIIYPSGKMALKKCATKTLDGNEAAAKNQKTHHDTPSSQRPGGEAIHHASTWTNMEKIQNTVSCRDCY